MRFVRHCRYAYPKIRSWHVSAALAAWLAIRFALLGDTGRFRSHGGWRVSRLCRGAGKADGVAYRRKGFPGHQFWKQLELLDDMELNVDLRKREVRAEIDELRRTLEEIRAELAALEKK